MRTSEIIPIDPVTGERDWSEVPRSELPQEKPRSIWRVYLALVVIAAATLTWFIHA